MSTRAAVVGGGPGGAFVARLLRLSQPRWEVSLFDAHPPLETFGFGVGLSISTQQNLGRSDRETFEEIFKVSQRGHGVRLHAGSGFVRIPGNDQMAVARAELLQILYRKAEKAGVRIETGATADAFDLDADVVIAADGLGSSTRTGHADEFGAREVTGRQRYIWCGADVALPDAMFAPVRTEHGVFTTHAYPYREDRSTFLVETDERTWRSAGFEHTSVGLAPGESDEPSRSYLQSVFSQQLNGASLLGNHSRWMQFRTVRCDRWFRGNVVLVGDAAHTAHYSIGSGTKLAMEDAIVLAEALDKHGAVSDAYAYYQSARQPKVARLQTLADRSQLWWEGYVSRLDMSPEQLLISFLTRAGNVSISGFREREPKVAKAALSEYGTQPLPEENIEDWVIAQPFDHEGRHFEDRVAHHADATLTQVFSSQADPRDASTDEFIAACAESVASDRSDGIELDGGRTRLEVLQRLDVAERLKSELGLLTSVRAPAEFITDLAAGLVCARTDLVSFN